MRHVRSAAGAGWYHEPIGSPIIKHPKVKLKGAKSDPLMDVAREHYAAEKAGGTAFGPPPTPKALKASPTSEATTLRSIAIQKRAQLKAFKWYDAATEDSDTSAATMDAATFWLNYQIPEDYPKINGVLRGQTPPPPPRAEVLHTANEMFKEAGVKTTQPITLYRALRPEKGLNWSQKLKPGSTFEDDGMVSTTAQPDFAQGWLSLDGTADGLSKKPAAGSTVLEIRVPTGTTVVGGHPQFIETMLPPGSKLKVISSEKRIASGAHSPLDPDVPLPPFSYTHVVAEYIGN